MENVRQENKLSGSPEAGNNRANKPGNGALKRVPNRLWVWYLRSIWQSKAVIEIVELYDHTI